MSKNPTSKHLTSRMLSRIALPLALVIAALPAVSCNRSQADPSSQTPARASGAGRLFAGVVGPKMVEREIPAGTELDIRLTTGLSSSQSIAGDMVRGRLSRSVLIDGRTAIPAGSSVTGHVTEARALRKIGGSSQLAFEFDTLTLPGGRAYDMQAGFSRTGRSETRKDTATILGSTILGAVIGHQIDGDRRGTATGALAGAGVGTAIAVGTKGETIALPAGTLVRLRLQGPIRVEIKERG